jgi:hypothetical protein
MRHQQKDVADRDIRLAGKVVGLSRRRPRRPNARQCEAQNERPPGMGLHCCNLQHISKRFQPACGLARMKPLCQTAAPFAETK